MNWLVWLGFVVLVATFAFAYARLPAARDLVVFVGSSLGVAGTVVAALIAARGLQDSARQNREANIHSRQEAAFSYMREWQDLPLSTIRAFRAETHGKSPQQVQSLLEAKPDYAQALEAALNFYEILGLAVASRYADEHLLCTHFKDTAVENYTAFEPWLSWYRKRRGIPDAFSNYDTLFRRWMSGCPSQHV